MAKKINLHYMVLIFLIVLLAVFMGFRSPYFFTAANLCVLVDNFIMEAIMALGMTLVIISGGIDLTVAGVLPFSSIVLALFMIRGVPFAAAIMLVLAAAAGVGCLTNLFRKKLNLHPMVVTMAIAAVLKGLNLTLTGGSAISNFSEGFSAWSTRRIAGMPLSWIVYILLAAVFIYFSKNKKSFQQIYFVGGIKVEGVYRNVYIISAVLAAAAGILTAMTYSSASYSYGTNADLRVITTVAIGGTSLTHGGYGSVTGTLLGTLFMAMIYNAFVMSGISTYYQDVVTGAFLIAAVLMSEGMNILKKRHS